MPQYAITQVLRNGALLWSQLRMMAPDMIQGLGKVVSSQHLTDGLGSELLAFIQERLPRQTAMAINRATRSSVCGWVLNRPLMPSAERGLMIIICAVSGCCSAASKGTRCA